MDKLPVGQLPDISQSSLDDEIMIITEADTSQLRKEKISNILTDIISVQEDNALAKGSDDKLFVTNFGNASNITEGVLPTSVLPQTGVEAGEYSYPSSVTVNAQGQITAIEEGTPSGANADTDLSNLTEEGEKHFLNKTQLTNCILEAPNGVPSYSGTTVTVQEGTNYLFPNGRNSNNSVKNVNFSLASAATGTITGSTVGAYCVFITSELELIFANQLNYFITNTQPTALNDSTTAGVWFNPQTNLIYQCAATASTPSWSNFKGAICATLSYDGSTITAFNPIYPVELLKRSDKEEITSWAAPNYNAIIDMSTPFTAPCAGVFYFLGVVDKGVRGFIKINDKEIIYGVSGAGNISFNTSGYVSKGDVITFFANSYLTKIFVPAKGAENA